MEAGIVGLPNVGKSTLFNALTVAGVPSLSYPFCTIEPNVGVVPVRDPRLDRVAELVGVGNVIYQHVEYVDVAGLVRDASKGAGRGNRFLENVRSCHALVHVVRCFEDPDVAHVQGVIDPVDDIRTVNLELILADLQAAEAALARLSKAARREADARPAAGLMEKIRDHLNDGNPLRSLPLSSAEQEIAAEFCFLTGRAVLYAVNIGEADLQSGASAHLDAVSRLAREEAGAVVTICAKIEDEIAGLATDEAAPFLEDLGLDEPGLQRFVRATRDLLGLISFFTFNEEQARAWTIPEGTTAQAAAGVIHTDFAEHFIRAEVTPFDDFDGAGGEKGAREHGLMRVEGRDYVVRDADVIFFRIGP